MAVVRVRQHVNPLSNKYQRTVEPPDWAGVFAQPERPLHLDIGCGKGHFLMAMATAVPEWNFLGLEIREPLVTTALQHRDAAGDRNLHFIFCNANTALRSLLAPWPGCPLRQVSIQFPDPWFKKRHQKRRVVQPELVTTLADFLPEAGRVVLQSDVEAVAQEMCDRFAESPAFCRTAEQWLPASPFPAQTEREIMTLEKALPIYRAIFTRTTLHPSG